LRLARINAAAAGVDVDTVHSDRVPSGCDLVIANPPYIMDESHRSYRDGGDLLGGSVALHWVRQTLHALEPGGAMLLYTGAAYTSGRSPAIDAIEGHCRAAGASFSAEEIDPDVFGEELEIPAYASVERLAAVGITIRSG
jgi:methylase of polypeptide subunit release factors